MEEVNMAALEAFARACKLNSGEEGCIIRNPL